MSIFKDVLYDVEWQKLRVSCLAIYHKDSGWATEKGTRANIDALDEYSHHNKKQEAFRRSWRILNCMNAVLEGYSGQGRTQTPQAIMAKDFQNSVSILYAHLKQTEDMGSWDWNKVRVDLKRLYINEALWFNRIYKDLTKKRTSTSTSKEKFLELMEEVKGE